MCSSPGCFSAEDCRNLISTPLHGFSELHDRGFIHGYLDIHSLIFTSVEATSALSDHQLRELLGNYCAEKRYPDSFEKESDYNLPTSIVRSKNLEPFIKLNR